MGSEIHAVHDTVERISCIDSVGLADILTDKGRLAYASRTLDANQRTVPVDSVYRLAYYIHRHLRDIHSVFFDE